MDALTLTLVVAFVLDLIVGDPRYAFHPVRLIGNGLIAPIERRLRAAGVDGRGGGLLLILGTVGMSVGAVALVSALLSAIPLAKEIFTLYVIYSCLAIKDLRVHVEQVQQALEGADLVLARSRLSMIVGRETSRLDEEGVARACVETVAENFSDGIVAPLFYGFLGGAPLMILYKAVNTMDSMVGYKSERYREFGFYPARLDDLLNWVPARLSMVMLMLAGAAASGSWVKAWRVAFRNRRRHSSPNAGHPEAAVAALLNLRLGGSNRYDGQIVHKPLINPDGDKVRPTHINPTLRLSLSASVLTLFVFSVVRAMV